MKSSSEHHTLISWKAGELWLSFCSTLLACCFVALVFIVWQANKLAESNHHNAVENARNIEENRENIEHLSRALEALKAVRPVGEGE